MHGKHSRPEWTTWSVRDGRLPSEALAEVAWLLASGEVVLLPTESSHALCVDVRRLDAVARARALKGRSDGGKPFLVLAGSLDQVRAVATLDRRAARLADEWPAPLTLILPPRDPALASALGAPGIGIRVPAHPTTRQVCRALGSPVTGTSANLASEAPVLDATMALAFAAHASSAGLAIAGMVDAGRLAGGPASTILDLTSPTPKLLRRGAFSVSRLEDILAMPLA